MKPALDEVRAIQRLALAEHWVRRGIYLLGAAGLFTLGWRRGTDAIPVTVVLCAPLLLCALLLLRFPRGGRISYHNYTLMDPRTAARLLVEAAHARRSDPRARWREALWWLYGYIENVTFALSVGFAVDALGGSLAVTLAAVAGMLTLNGIANALDLRMRFADARLTFTLPLEDAADGAPEPSEGEQADGHP